MRKPFLVSSALGLIALLIGIAMITPIVSAAPTPTPIPSPAAPGSGGQALEIAPPVMNLTADPGQTIKAQISLRDIASTNLIVTGQINDFTAGGEDGKPKIILDESEPNPYSLKGWVAPLPKLTLKPRQIENLPVTITVPANAAPGGYYAVVRFTATPPELQDTGVSLSASLGALILLRVNGDVKESLTIEEFSVNSHGKTGTLFEGTPLNFVQRFKNAGSVHEQPVGLVTITDMFGKDVAAVRVNQPPRNILPDSIRKFEQPLDSSTLGTTQLFGRYTAKLSVAYGEKKQVVTSSIEFWVIPYTLIATVIVLLIGGFFLLRFVIKRYNRSVVRKAQGGRRRR